MIRRLKALSADDRWLVVSYLATIVWAVLFIRYTPLVLVETVDRLQLILAAGLPLAGMIPAIFGVITNRHLTFELPGVLLRYGGIASYGCFQFGLAFVNPDRIALVGLVVLLLAEMSRRAHYLVKTAYKRVTRPVVVEIIP